MNCVLCPVSAVYSNLFPIAFETNKPVLLCAPNSAGKIDVVMLTVPSELSKRRIDKIGKFDLDGFRIACIASVNVLVQDMVRNFLNHLKVLGVKVGNLLRLPSDKATDR